MRGSEDLSPRTQLELRLSAQWVRVILGKIGYILLCRFVMFFLELPSFFANVNRVSKVAIVMPGNLVAGKFPVREWAPM